MRIGRQKLNIDTLEAIFIVVGNNVNFCGFAIRIFASLNLNSWQGVVIVVGKQILKQVKVKN